MEIKDMLSTGAMLIIGVIALKAFGGIEGLGKMFSGLSEGIGSLAGGAPGTGAPGLSGAVFTGVDVPIVDVLPEEPAIAHIPSAIDLFGLGTIPPTPILTSDIIPDPEAQPPSLLDLINPFVRMPAPYTYTPPITYTPSPTVTTPLGTTGWMQTPDMVDDPIHPGIGGR